MTAATPHPAHDLLARFGHGLLLPEEHQAVEAHVSTCDECTARLTALDADSLALLLRNGPSLAARPDATPMPPSLSGPTAPLPGLPLREGPLAHGDPGAIPEPLRDHPRYRVLRLLGQGGMGNVYLAEHRHMGRPVALKVINPGILDNPAAVRRFRQEVQAAARLSHPNIVQAHDADEADGLHFLVLEYVEGQPLASCAAAGPLPYPEACEYARQAAVALQYAHEAGLVHRDVKPHNLMVTADGRVKVLDFGLARLLARPDSAGSVGTQAGALMGTPDYMPPEQARDAGTADSRADVYSLGCTLYHLLTGRPPFPGGTPIEKVARHLTEDVPALDAAALGLPAGLAEVVARMTARDPGQRYQTAGEAAAALAPFVSPGGRPSGQGATPAVERGKVPRPDATVQAPPSRGPRDPARVPWGWVGAAAAFFGLGALAAGVVIYRIQTDKGEIVIRTVDEDVEVVVKQGGKLVTIHDPKTKQKLILRSGTYELELKGMPTGLKLELDSVTLKRGDVKIARITHISKGRPTDEKGKAPAEMKLVRKIPVSAPRDLLYWHAVSKGGKYALVTYDRVPYTVGQCDVFDVATGNKLVSCEGYHAEFLGAGEQVVVEYQREFRVYETRTGKLLRKGGHGGYWGMKVAPDQKHLVYFGPGRCALFDLDAMKDVKSWAPTSSMHFTADGKLLLSLSDKGTTRTDWDLKTGPVADSPEIVGQREYLFPDGKSAALYRDKKGSRVDLRTGKVIGSLLDKPIPNNLSGTYSADGRLIVALCRGGEVLQYPLPPDGKAQSRYQLPDDDQTLQNAKYPRPVAISADTHFVGLLTTRSLYVLRLPPLSEPPPPRDEGKRDNPGDEEKKAVTKLPLRALTYPPRIATTSVTFTPDGERVLVGHGDGTVQLWDVKTGERLWSRKEHPESVWGLSISPDGRHALTSGQDHARRLDFGPRLWDLKSGTVIRKYPGHKDNTGTVHFLDRRRAVSSSWDSTVRLWDVETGVQLACWPQPDTSCAAVLPDGDHLLFAQVSGNVALHRLSDGKQVKALGTHNASLATGRLHLCCVAVSPDGRVGATGAEDSAVALWDLAKGRRAGTLVGHKGAVVGLAFLPKGRLLTSGRDGTVRLWNVARGEELARLPSSGGHYQFLAVTRKGDLAAIGGDDGTLLLWKIPE